MCFYERIQVPKKYSNRYICMPQNPHYDGARKVDPKNCFTYKKKALVVSDADKIRTCEAEAIRWLNE